MHLILGFGATGASFYRYLNKKNVPTLVVDSRERPSGLKEFDDVNEGNFFLGKFDLKILDKVETILVSPGIEYGNEILVRGREKGIEALNSFSILKTVAVNHG